MGTEGSVFVSFVVDRAGTISEISVVKGISAECDKEAVRVVGMMPPWKPGKQNGKAVKSRFVLPVKFKLAT
jgi:protein TonB